MKTHHEILTEFGCPTIPFDENVTMYYPAIISAMEEAVSQSKSQVTDEAIGAMIEKLFKSYNYEANYRPAWIKSKGINIVRKELNLNP